MGEQGVLLASYLLLGKWQETVLSASQAHSLDTSGLGHCQWKKGLPADLTVAHDHVLRRDGPFGLWAHA